MLTATKINSQELELKSTLRVGAGIGTEISWQHYNRNMNRITFMELVIYLSFWQLLLLHPFNGLFPGQLGWACTRKVNHSGFYWSKRWLGGSGISWTICKSFAPRFRQITIVLFLSATLHVRFIHGQLLVHLYALLSCHAASVKRFFINRAFYGK